MAIYLLKRSELQSNSHKRPTRHNSTTILKAYLTIKRKIKNKRKYNKKLCTCYHFHCSSDESIASSKHVKLEKPVLQQRELDEEVRTGSSEGGSSRSRGKNSVWKDRVSEAIVQMASKYVQTLRSTRVPRYVENDEKMHRWRKILNEMNISLRFYLAAVEFLKSNDLAQSFFVLMRPDCRMVWLQQKIGSQFPGTMPPSPPQDHPNVPRLMNNTSPID